MAESMNALARRGLVSSNAVLKATTVQKSKMASFNGRQKDEGKAHAKGHPIARVGHINAGSTQADRAKSTPSKGARVNASQTPKRSAIDKFPGKQATIWPAKTGVKASKGFTGNTKMKGGPKPKSGGAYGGPSSRAAG